MKIPSIYFDRKDHQLLACTDAMHKASEKEFQALLERYLHPQGIKELAASRGLRIACAAVRLLDSLEESNSEKRVLALRSLHNELRYAGNPFNHNAARVMVQTMKELLRSFNSNGKNYPQATLPLINETRTYSKKQLQLAHEFRLATVGNPRIIRHLLERCHLLEMPEEWNQIAFDNHVHDANTKGRKNPVHLVLDAWIKGLRQLTVVYYNFLDAAAANELLAAGEILGVHIQISVEFSIAFHNKYINLSWEPGGFDNQTDLLKFINNEEVKKLFAEGAEVSQYQQNYIFAALKEFNIKHRHTLSKQIKTDIAELKLDKFLAFIGPGEPSLLHLASYISSVLPNSVQKGHNAPSLAQITNEYLIPKKNPNLHNPNDPNQSKNAPSLLRITLPTLINRLLKIHPASQLTLNAANLTAEDILELLYLGHGTINHIELYNLKNSSRILEQHSTPSSANKTKNVPSENIEKPQHALQRYFKRIHQLQEAINTNNPVQLKHAVRTIIEDYEKRLQNQQKEVLAGAEHSTLLHMKQRRLDLLAILSNLDKLHAYYDGKTLQTRLGSSSTGHATDHYFGMGLVVIDTLPKRVKKELIKKQQQGELEMLPATAVVTRNIHQRLSKKGLKSVTDQHVNLPTNWQDWTLDSIDVQLEENGNIAPLGGSRHYYSNKKKLSNWFYFNSHLKNILKITMGFIPAMLTFLLTKDWWLLAWFGAPIWFTITGGRNIIQSILGGGGLRRSPLLRWNSLISWSRIADSLLFTGFSVPLLDWLVKNLLLDSHYGITTATDPLMLYAVMGLANGIYISSHNLIRGLPKGAIIGNFFRSILAIPVAFTLNFALGTVLSSFAIAGVDAILQKWAAIISKFASDCVAAVIEGLADRKANIDARLAAYRAKFLQLYDVFAQIDLLLPEKDTIALLANADITQRELQKSCKTAYRLLIVNALDFLYFWYYQPRAGKALQLFLEELGEEERLILINSQQILSKQKEISRLFIDGLIGTHFARALAFYLNLHKKYLRSIEKISANLLS